MKIKVDSHVDDGWVNNMNHSAFEFIHTAIPNIVNIALVHKNLFTKSIQIVYIPYNKLKE